MRDSISTFLANAASNDPNFYVLSGDHGYALFDEIRRVAPNQFINVGVCEQGMVGYAAGMIKQGLKVVIYGLSAFVPIRVIEFIKMDICYENLPLMILGDGAGVVYSTLGSSHQCGEDISCLRPMPNMNIFSPCDKYEMSASLEKAFQLNSPSYIRIGKSDKPIVHQQKINLSLKAELIPINKENKSKICLIATGSMVLTAFEISEKLNCSVFSIPELTGLNIPFIKEQLKHFEYVFTLEEHSISGGLGSIIAELIADQNLNLKLKRFGFNHKFTKSCGSYEYVIQEHKLDFNSIFNEINKLLV